MIRKYILPLSIVALMLFFILLSLYIKNINIYKPFAIEIQGINITQKNDINIYGISPLNKKIDIAYEQSIQAWLHYYGYFKQVNVAINKSIISDNDTLLLTSQNTFKKIRLSDLKIFSEKDKYITYVIPYEFFGDRILAKLLFSIIYHNKSKPLFKITLITIGLLILFYILLELIKNKFLFKKLPSLLKSFLISTAIALCLFFGFLYIKYSLTTLFTALLFILFVGGVLHFILLSMHKIFKIIDSFYLRIRKSINAFIIVWLLLETLLRISGINRSYNERTGGYYMSGFIRDMVVDKDNPKLHIHPPHNLLIVERNEFNYPFKYNADGLRDKTRNVEKDSNEFRIVCLGNSYTEGIGAPQDSTWPALLENYLKNKTLHSVSVFNAGVTSADPFFEFMLLKEKVIKYKPDLVLMSLSHTDLEFYRFRGGFERFVPNGVEYRKPPLFEKIYAVSHIARFITDKILKFKFLMPPNEFKNDRLKAYIDIYNCMHFFYQLSILEKFKFAVIFNDDRPHLYKTLMQRLKSEKIIDIIDLYEYNLKFENLTDENYWKYKWKIDGHYNSMGYEMFARGVATNILNKAYFN